MKSPSGFGKNYFTFSAILAYSVQNKLNAQISSIHSLFFNVTDKEDDEVEEEELPLDILNPLCFLNTKPCHCNCFFKIKTKLTLLSNIFIPRCPYYTTYFAFRRSGVHPPKTIFFKLIKQKNQGYKNVKKLHRRVSKNWRTKRTEKSIREFLGK